MDNLILEITSIFNKAFLNAKKLSETNIPHEDREHLIDSLYGDVIAISGLLIAYINISKVEDEFYVTAKKACSTLNSILATEWKS